LGRLRGGVKSLGRRLDLLGTLVLVGGHGSGDSLRFLHGEIGNARGGGADRLFGCHVEHLYVSGGWVCILKRGFGGRNASKVSCCSISNEVGGQSGWSIRVVDQVEVEVEDS
jgi:hypothetical protein